MRTLFIVFFCALSAPLFSQISIKWKTINLVEGYEYEGKIKVYIDDEFVGESPVCWESKLCQYKIKVKGKHKIRIEQYANYKGNWEAKTIANDYSYDCVYENTFTFKKKQTLTIIWDTDSENIDVTLKKQKDRDFKAKIDCQASSKIATFEKCLDRTTYFFSIHVVPK